VTLNGRIKIDCIIDAMSEPTTPSTPEPTTTPDPTTPTAAPAYEQPRRSRLTTVAASVGIAAGAVFIVAVIFFSGFILGAHAGGQRGHGFQGHHRGGPDMATIHRGPMPMIPMMPRGERPSFGPGGPSAESPSSPTPPSPGTTAPSRP
jgi:hypothetical protein